MDNEKKHYETVYGDPLEFKKEITESIKSLFELTTRIDERVQNITQCQIELKNKFDAHSTIINDLNTKIAIIDSKDIFKELKDEINNLKNKLSELQMKLNDFKNLHDKEIDDIEHISKSLSNAIKNINNLELRLQTIENTSNQQENRWNTIFKFVIQIIWALIATYLLYKLGLQAPIGG